MHTVGVVEDEEEQVLMDMIASKKTYINEINAFFCVYLMISNVH